MKRLVLVYNPRSSRHEAVESEVLAQARGLSGWVVAKYEVRPARVMVNATKLAQIIADGDLVVSAGGDGTTAVAVNAIMLSQKDANLGILGYGNFNDLANSLGAKNLAQIIEAYDKGQKEQLYPLEVRGDGKVFRYALGYVTMGLFATSTHALEEESVRKKLARGKSTRDLALRTLVKWYMKNHKRKFLPEFSLNGETMQKKTDYLAINSPVVAGMMKSKNYMAESKDFLHTVVDLSGLFGMASFMLHSKHSGVKGETSTRDVLEFPEAWEIEVQTEGEVERVNAKTIEIAKTSPINCVAFKA